MRSSRLEIKNERINSLAIWAISKYASPPKYGVGARLYYISKSFSDMGHQVTLISSDANHLSSYPQTKRVYNHENYDNLEHIFIKTFKYSKNASLKRFISWFDFNVKLLFMKKGKLIRPDIIIISSLALTSILVGYVLKLIYRSKLVFEVRDIYPLTLVEDFKVKKWNPIILYFKWVERFAYKKSDLIVGTMPNLKEHVALVTKKHKKVFFSPIGIHEKWSSKLLIDENIENLFKDVKNKFVVGYAGSMGVSNALDIFIKVIKNMSKEAGIHFVLVGSGDLKENYIKQLNNFENVTIGPKIDQQFIPQFLKKCDLLYLSTHPSKIWNYGQSLNKVIDYMMAAKPIIASYDGFQTMINEAKSGIFVPTNNAEIVIEKILEFKNMPINERLKIGKNGHEWIINNHKYELISKKYINELGSLLR